MYVKPNNSGKDMWLLAQTANQKLKQNAQTQDVDGMQAFPVLYIKNSEAISQR